jgi:mercuric ion transport protein
MSATRAEASEATSHLPTSAALRRDRVRTQRLIAAGGILGALGAASCCVLPFALFLAGVSGAWIGNLTALEPYQPIFAIVSLGFVGYGAWRLYLRSKRACADGYCAAPQSDRIAKIGLWIAGTLVAVALAFPYAAGYFL